MQLTLSDVEKVARLARLKLAPEELDRLQRQLGSILDYVDLLNEVDTTGVAPMAHAADVLNVFRDDVPTASLPRSQALANAPKASEKYFLVPPILEGN
jgi:aspartyl-tRNA(Asn)/glutamyl-tRNA(Gln) amidotransferase subunit C